MHFYQFLKKYYQTRIIKQTVLYPCKIWVVYLILVCLFIYNCIFYDITVNKNTIGYQFWLKILSFKINIIPNIQFLITLNLNTQKKN